jgi:hypothetical protein
VKLFLDAHISAQRVAAPLRERGHDVRAADEERELDGLTDEEMLSIAASEERIFVTFDVKDFPVIARRWAEAGRAHAGCAIVVGVDHGEIGTILAAIARELSARPQSAAWTDLTVFLARSGKGLSQEGLASRSSIGGPVEGRAAGRGGLRMIRGLAPPWAAPSAST